jgi:hypothetical protein
MIDDVHPVTLKQLYNEAREIYDSIWEQARNLDRDVKIYLHWTAGRYGQFWDAYHIQIDEDGTIYRNELLDLDDPGDGTWLRNTGAINVTILGCFDANTGWKGTNPPTEKQIESMSMVITTLCDALDLSIDMNHVMTHGEAADNEDGYYGAYGEEDEYGPKSDWERWDLEILWMDKSWYADPYDEGSRGGDVLRGKANWYRAEYGVGKTADLPT